MVLEARLSRSADELSDQVRDEFSEAVQVYGRTVVITTKINCTFDIVLDPIAVIDWQVDTEETK